MFFFLLQEDADHHNLQGSLMMLTAQAMFLLIESEAKS